MKYYLQELSRNIGGPMTAGIKAREDVEAVFRMLGYTDIGILTAVHKRDTTVHKLLASTETSKQWKLLSKKLQPGDTLAVQLPPSENTLSLGRRMRAIHRKGVKTIAVIHDLEALRFGMIKRGRAWKRRVRIHFEEEIALKYFDHIIVHNEKMKDVMIRMGYPASKLVSLGIFDYLTQPALKPERVGDPAGVIVAGNLMPSKSGYVYELPEVHGCRFNLYGVNFEEMQAEHIRYYGAFPSDQLPYILNGKFGLVWDGPSAKTCADVFGEYLKINNPHKTSLYLASGIPVVIWDQAALADFVKENNCGITVASLYDLPDAIAKVSDAQYEEMRLAAARMSEKLRDGAFLKAAVGKCE
ncbi:MAG: galactofuranosyltransferase [Clostridia bacterium]|nr:galactofuranosyltransferase [Clostridia bacterium]